ncbi:tetratricopeptide repeat-containing protein [Cardiosporidium cionae]|uniref:Tetratricopeptide repeat-containing protein n=1 Tax=Cardiosporidium cionae TaxID=476202 RepID=A0ABQ7JDY2_9APIC|nr:tetratricopeptide repeat-containing protein [Cardiosporidium cionae]|eukprot:KAF8822208.1 tetratricopeptide repeat-containing protein [Cardiosporidium cionae]
MLREFASARTHFTASLQFRVTAIAWSGIGLTWMHAGNDEQAYNAFVQSNILNPYTADTWGYLTITLLHLGKLEQAETTLGALFQSNLKDAKMLLQIATELSDPTQRLLQPYVSICQIFFKMARNYS